MGGNSSRRGTPSPDVVPVQLVMRKHRAGRGGRAAWPRGPERARYAPSPPSRCCPPRPTLLQVRDGQQRPVVPPRHPLVRDGHHPRVRLRLVGRRPAAGRQLDGAPLPPPRSHRLLRGWLPRALRHPRLDGAQRVAAPPRVARRLPPGRRVRGRAVQQHQGRRRHARRGGCNALRDVRAIEQAQGPSPRPPSRAVIALVRAGTASMAVFL